MGYIPVLLQLACLSGVFCLGTVWSSAYIEPVSRRIVNLAYICWIVSCSKFLLDLLQLQTHYYIQCVLKYVCVIVVGVLAPENHLEYQDKALILSFTLRESNITFQTKVIHL